MLALSARRCFSFYRHFDINNRVRCFFVVFLLYRLFRETMLQRHAGRVPGIEDVRPVVPTARHRFAPRASAVFLAAALVFCVSAAVLSYRGLSAAPPGSDPSLLALCPSTRAGMLHFVADWLEEHQAPYCLCFGTLLGLVRDGNIIPWTGDVDLCVFWSTGEARDLIVEIPCFDVTKLAYRYVSLRPRNPDAERVAPWWRVLLGLEPRTVYVDLYGVTSENGGPQLWVLGAAPVHRDLIWPLVSFEALGRTWPIPREAEAWLAALYGADWRTPDPHNRLGMETPGIEKAPMVTLAPPSGANAVSLLPERPLYIFSWYTRARETSPPPPQSSV